MVIEIAPSDFIQCKMPQVKSTRGMRTTQREEFEFANFRNLVFRYQKLVGARFPKESLEAASANSSSVAGEPPPQTLAGKFKII